jgi:rhodanese-related sulfurtransferase
MQAQILTRAQGGGTTTRMLFETVAAPLRGFPAKSASASDRAPATMRPLSRPRARRLARRPGPARPAAARRARALGGRDLRAAGRGADPDGPIPAEADSLDPDRPVVCYCHHGMRSMQVGAFLERRGFDHVWNLTGGIDAWARQVDPACPTY